MELIEKLKRFDDITEVLYPSSKYNYMWILTQSKIINDFIDSLSSEELTSEIFESYIYNKVYNYFINNRETEALFKSLKEEEKSEVTYFFYIHQKLAEYGRYVYELDKKISEKMYSILKNILLKNKYYNIHYALDDITANNMLSGRSRYGYDYTPYNDNALSYILRHTIGDVKFNYLLLQDSSEPDNIITYGSYSCDTRPALNRLDTAEKILTEFLSLDVHQRICSDVVVRAICDVVLQYSKNAKDFMSAIKESNSIIFANYSNFNILATNKNITLEDNKEFIAQSFRQKDVNKYIKSLRESKDMLIISSFLDAGIYNNNRIKAENKDIRAMDIVLPVLIGTPSKYYDDSFYSFSHQKEFWEKYPGLKYSIESFCISSILQDDHWRKQKKIENCSVLLCEMNNYLDPYEYFTKFVNILITNLKQIDEPRYKIKYLLYMVSYMTFRNTEIKDNREKEIDKILNFNTIENIYFNVLKDYKNDSNFKELFGNYLRIIINYIFNMHPKNELSSLFNEVVSKESQDNILVNISDCCELYKYLLRIKLLSLTPIGIINQELDYPLKDEFNIKYLNISELNIFNEDNKNNNICDKHMTVFADPSLLLAYALKDDFVNNNNNLINKITCRYSDESVFAPNIQYVGSKMIFKTRLEQYIHGEITHSMYSPFNNINKFLYLLDMYLNNFDDFKAISLTTAIENVDEYLVNKYGFKKYAVTDNSWYRNDTYYMYYNENIDITLSRKDFNYYSMLFSTASIFKSFDVIKHNIAIKYLNFFASDNFINLCLSEWAAMYNDMVAKGKYNGDFDRFTNKDTSYFATDINYDLHFNDTYYTFLEKFIKSLNLNQIIELSGVKSEINEEYVLNRLRENSMEITLVSTISE